MYLTAQRVIAHGGQEGINAFHYKHGAQSWSGLPPPGIPDQDPGVLAGERIAVPPPGNRVRGYLDIVAPDDTPAGEIRQSLVMFLSRVQRAPLPWEGVVGRCLFRVGLEQALAGQWRRELAQLYRALSELLK